MVDGRAKLAARYPDALCRAICKGIIEEKKERANNLRAVVEIDERTRPFRMDLEEHHEREEAEIQLYPLMRLTHGTKNRNDVSEALAWDDLTGMRLDAQKVIEARSREIQYVRDMSVWIKIPRRQAQARGMKVRNTRWIDISKGETTNPIYRSKIGRQIIQ